MTTALVVAADLNGGIGIKNRLPWRLKDDMKFFKNLTEGHNVVMGRKTFDSLGNKPLAKRMNYVLSRDTKPRKIEYNNLIYATLDPASLSKSQRGRSKEFIIGGSEIYDLILPCAHEIYLTRVDTVATCDTFLSDTFNELINSKKVDREILKVQKKNERNQHSFTIYKYTIND